MPDEHAITPLTSTKGILALGIVFGFIIMMASGVIYILTNPSMSVDNKVFENLLMFMGATSTMGMIVILVVQNFFRKTEAQ